MKTKRKTGLKKKVAKKMSNETRLRMEFNDLIESDKDFNYSKSEFKEWLKDFGLKI